MQHGGAAALRDPLRVTADGAGMRGLANQPEADAGRFCPLNGDRGGLHDRDRAKTVAAVEHESRGAVMRQARLHLHVDFAAGEKFDVARQPRHAVAVAAAQIGPDQSLGDDGGVLFARAMGDEHVADEAAELIVADGDSSQPAHFAAGK